MDNLLRRRVMTEASGGGGGPLFPFLDEASTTNVVISNGNHISYQNRYTGSATFINPYVGVGAVSVVNNKPKMFTIHAGDVVKIISEVTSASSLQSWSTNFRKANDSTSLSYGSGNHTGIGRYEVNAVATQDDDVGCFFMYVDPTGLNTSFEADFECYINGVRYF